MPIWIAHWLRDARLLLASQLVVVLTTTALAIILARSLGPEDWGFFSALLGLSLALSTFVDLGLGTWLLRDLSRLREERAPEQEERESSRRVIGGVVANAAMGAVLLLGSAVACVAVRAEVVTVIALLALVAYTVFLTASNCLETYLRAKRSLKRVVAAVLLEKFLLLVLIVGAMAFDLGIWAIGISYLAAGVARLSFVGFTIFVREHLPVVVPALEDVRRFVLSGVPFAFNTVALNVIPRLDTFLIAIVSTTAAGYFALGDRIIGPAMIVPVVAVTALYPFLAREAPGSRAAWRISAGMMLLGFGAAVVGFFVAPAVVPAVFGRSYDDAVPVVQLMLFVIPFAYASNPLLAQLYTNEKERKVLAATLVASLLGTASVIIGQIWFGPLGAATGYVLRHVLFTLTLTGIALIHRSHGEGYESFESPTTSLIREPTPGE